jgi:hypothetical protein
VAKKKHRGTGAPAVKVPEAEKLALPFYIRKELAKMKAAGKWEGDPFSPDLDPAVTLSIIMVDERNDPALRAACAKSLIPFIHEDRSLAFKLQASDTGGPIMVTVRSFSRGEAPETKAPAALPFAAFRVGPEAMHTQPAPEPATPAAIDRTRAPGAAYYETYRDPVDGVEKMRQVDEAPRAYNGVPDVEVKKEWDA